jgi:hypothetical protein
VSSPAPHAGTRGGHAPPAACGADDVAGRACRWATVEVWLHPPEVVGAAVLVAATDRQVCLRCGAGRLVRVPDGRGVGDAPPPPARTAA